MEMIMEMNLTAAVAPQLLEIQKSKVPFTEPKGGFDLRMVRYEEVHNIQPTDFDKLVKIIDPQKDEIILDAGGGYGSVSREILSRFPNLNLGLIVYDLYEVQLKRGISELSNLLEALSNNQVKLVHGDLRTIDLPDNSVDKVVAKMVIHEIRLFEQVKIFEEFYRILKPGGKLIIWDVNLNLQTQKFFQDVIRKKDELATFRHLTGTRYFLREEEMQKLAETSNFKHFTKEHTFTYKLNTERRLNSEFKGDLNKLNTWNDFIREKAKKLPAKTLEEINYSDNKVTIKLEIEKAIFTCYK